MTFRSQLTTDAPDEETHHLEPLIPPTLTIKLTSLAGVTIPFAGFLTVVILLWGRGFDWLHCSLFVAMYLVSALGVTVGYHRYYCHRSFQTSRVVQCALALFGSFALEGPVLKWVAVHRRHHRNADHENDPHSPHLHGDGVMGVLKGFWHAHVGWVFDGDPADLYHYVGDLSSDRMVRIMSKLWLVWAVLGVLIPAALGGLISMSWSGALLGFLWGGLARIFLVHHVTWSVNSVCHLWGSRPFKSDDDSRNNFIFGVLALGEGWHNGHHAFPTSARHGLRWWELDVSYLLLVVLSWIHVVWDLKLPSPDRVAGRMRTSTSLE